MLKKKTFLRITLTLKKETKEKKESSSRQIKSAVKVVDAEEE